MRIIVSMVRLNAQQLRQKSKDELEREMYSIKRNPIYLILENIYDTYNVGGLFRLADALAVERVYLCGEIEVPPHHKVVKASIGTYKVVPWVYKKTTLEAIDDLRKGGGEDDSSLPIDRTNMQHKTLTEENVMGNDRDISPIIVAVEQDTRSIPYTSVPRKLPMALVVGNETYGVLPQTLDYVDYIAEIPMFGVNTSLNVIVSAAIVSYWMLGQTGKK